MNTTRKESKASKTEKSDATNPVQVYNATVASVGTDAEDINLKFVNHIVAKTETEEGNLIGGFISANVLMKQPNTKINGIVQVRLDGVGTVDESLQRQMKSLQNTNDRLNPQIRESEMKAAVQQKVIESLKQRCADQETQIQALKLQLKTQQLEMQAEFDRKLECEKLEMKAALNNQKQEWKTQLEIGRESLIYAFDSVMNSM